MNQWIRFAFLQLFGSSLWLLVNSLLLIDDDISTSIMTFYFAIIQISIIGYRLCMDAFIMNRCSTKIRRKSLLFNVILLILSTLVTFVPSNEIQNVVIEKWKYILYYITFSIWISSQLYFQYRAYKFIQSDYFLPLT
jgi:hypothetical protein